MSVKVKICGITTLEDARAALSAGAAALGLNFAPRSPRYLDDLPRARKIAEYASARGALAVGVFTRADPEEIVQTARAAVCTAVQWHGDEAPAWGRALRARLKVPLWKACRVGGLSDLRVIEAEDWPCDALLLDARVPGGRLGGTGESFDWSLLKNFAPAQSPRPKPLILAGGLTPENVARAVRLVKPDWVDTASGVEAAPGVKDPGKLKAFIAAAGSLKS